MTVLPDLFYAFQMLKFRLDAYLDKDYMKEVDKAAEADSDGEQNVMFGLVRTTLKRKSAHAQVLCERALKMRTQKQ